VSPTVTDMEPLHLSVRLSSLVDVVTIFSPRRYNGCCLVFSASELASLAVVEFLAAYLPSALLWSSETAWSTAFRVSEESHSGLASQPLRRIRTRKLQRTNSRLRKYGIEIRHTPPALNPHRATDSKRHCSNGANQTVARQHFFGIGAKAVWRLDLAFGGHKVRPAASIWNMASYAEKRAPSGISQSHRRGHHHQNAPATPTIGGHAQPRKLKSLVRYASAMPQICDVEVNNPAQCGRTICPPPEPTQFPPACFYVIQIYGKAK
jgi:hypothetical protein